MASKIYSVEAIEDNKLKTTFFNGEVRVMDVNEERSIMPIYDFILKDDKTFKSFAVGKSKDYIIWPNGVRINNEVLWSSGVYAETVNIRDVNIAFAERMRTMRETVFMSQKNLEAKTGIHQADISKIERGEGNPSLNTMKRLTEGMGFDLQFFAAMKVHEDEFKTIDDVMALPEDSLVELIDGVMYDMASPNIFHQSIVSEIHYCFQDYIKKKGGDCLVVEAPTSVIFDEDKYNYLLPDLLVVCDPSKFRREGIQGAPDFILEVTSKSTCKNDYGRKQAIYSEKGVREYWIIDTKNMKLVVYDYENDYCPQVHSLDEIVPVGIYHGDLEIDMKLIKNLWKKANPSKTSKKSS